MAKKPPTPAAETAPAKPGIRCHACDATYNPARHGITTIGSTAYFKCEKCGARNPGTATRPAVASSTR